MDAPTISTPGPVGTTAERILDAGMRCFAREGFAGATTRMIAAEAGVTLPVIAYHFGNKDGLHRACAQDIVEQHRRQILPLTSAAREAASGPLAPEAARDWLEKILAALVVMIAEDAGQKLGTQFILRELSEQGPGYELLYDELWKPGMSLVADLLAIARRRETGSEEDRAGAIMLLASLTAFTRDEPIARAFVGWGGFTPERSKLVTVLAKRLLAGLVTA